MNELWQQLATAGGVELTDEKVRLIDRYLDLLLAGNEGMNLTRITARPEAELLHIADSLTLLPHLPPGPHNLVDVGSGGGVPGIPLAIVRPDILISLIESTQKKANFLRETVAALDLANVTVIPFRAEKVGQAELRETFDVAVARAVATIDWLAEWCLPLVKIGGKMLAMKGPKVNEELPAAAPTFKVLGGGKPVIHKATLPDVDNHLIVQIDKVARSQTRYPRPPTHTKGKPLR